MQPCNNISMLLKFYCNHHQTTLPTCLIQMTTNFIPIGLRRIGIQWATKINVSYSCWSITCNSTSTNHILLKVMPTKDLHQSLFAHTLHSWWVLLKQYTKQRAVHLTKSYCPSEMFGSLWSSARSLWHFQGWQITKIFICSCQLVHLMNWYHKLQLFSRILRSWFILSALTRTTNLTLHG